ncbi:DUF1365 domain-containing protein [Azorhizobium oxalatiphilum]|uniref:DUF1365 domain-containing protein n=1 Tax=Azorhizobium oxalatiphilum TaxID=980631 RepID=A0A917BWF5_9HYPH|nr:DUF1365 family protein [Azorhizobium oxalatiphilum]GGF61184.1 DUF1365 domain-containing protein [Azorhizobium oxalatiphilum]
MSDPAPPRPTASALYDGTVVHHRLKPRVHRLSYRIFQLLFDLDEIDALDARLSLFSRNRFNLFSFRDADYGDRSGASLRGQVEGHLAAAGLEAQGGAIHLLTMPRVLGYGFNPLSVYFCHRRDGTLHAILYEVSNTFGERHSYLIPVDDPDMLPIRQSTEKCFYVSPFMDMALTYAFRVVPPADRVGIAIAARDEAGTVLTATLSSRRRKLDDRALLRAFVAIPLLTLKVIVGIHWEALKIALKGIHLRHRPAPPNQPVTIYRSES